MAEYRIDVVTDDNPDRPLAAEFFEARTDDAAFRKARKLMAPHVADPQTQYGELYVRDRDGGLSADYLGQVEATS